jgi:exo-beta-1,3-glucanase (GH17 family)
MARPPALDQIPAIAQRLGLTVWQGACIGRDAALNAREVTRALDLAAQHPGVVVRVIVGSETLLRGEQTAEAMAGLIAEARRRSTVPIAYADVWEFWLRHGETLAPVVDEALIHVLPDWEDTPVAISQAVDHLFDTCARMRERLHPVPVIIGETGWPAAVALAAGAPGCRSRPASCADCCRVRCRIGLLINVIEAFDQPWKAELEGVAGASWGVFGSDARPRFALDESGSAGPADRQPGRARLSPLGGYRIARWPDRGGRGAGDRRGQTARPPDTERFTRAAHLDSRGALLGGWIGAMVWLQAQTPAFLTPLAWPWWPRAIALGLTCLWALIILRGPRAAAPRAIGSVSARSDRSW